MKILIIYDKADGVYEFGIYLELSSKRVTFSSGIAESRAAAVEAVGDFLLELSMSVEGPTIQDNTIKDAVAERQGA